MLTNTMTETEQKIMDHVGTMLKAMPDTKKDRLLIFSEGMATMAMLQQQAGQGPESMT